MNEGAMIDAKRLLKERRASLEELTIAGVLHEWDEGRLRCSACAHRCVLGDGGTGICGVRVRRGEELRVPFGYVARKYVRPVETNTLFHVRTGARARPRDGARDGRAHHA